MQPEWELKPAELRPVLNTSITSRVEATRTTPVLPYPGLGSCGSGGRRCLASRSPLCNDTSDVSDMFRGIFAAVWGMKLDAALEFGSGGRPATGVTSGRG